MGLGVLALTTIDHDKVLREIEKDIEKAMTIGEINEDTAKATEKQVLLFIKQYFPDAEKHIEISTEYNPDTGMVCMEVKSKGTPEGDLIVGLLKSAQENEGE